VASRGPAGGCALHGGTLDHAWEAGYLAEGALPGASALLPKSLAISRSGPLIDVLDIRYWQSVLTTSAVARHNPKKVKDALWRIVLRRMIDYRLS